MFTSSLKDPAEAATGPLARCVFEFPSSGQARARRLIDVLLTTVSFAVGDVQADRPTPAGWSVNVFTALGVPVIQAICSGSARWQWETSQRGLSPLDTAMNVALPEFDGRIITVPVSFKEPRYRYGR